MSFVSRLLERQRQRRATARHYQPPGTKNAACAKPRSGKRGRRGSPGVPTKTTREIALVTCEDCRVAARLVGVLFVVIVGACGDNLAPPVPPDAPKPARIPLDGPLACNACQRGHLACDANNVCSCDGEVCQ